MSSSHCQRHTQCASPLPSSRLSPVLSDDRNTADRLNSPPTLPVPWPCIHWNDLHIRQQTRSAISNTTLDIEARRLIFSAPFQAASSSPENSYALDLDLSQPDSDIEKYLGNEQSAQQALTLKRQREFDVDRARAEWRIAEGQFIIYA